MLTLLPQIVGMALLLAGVWLCYRRWVRPRAGLDFQSKGLLALVALTFMGGGVGSLVWWADAPWRFPGICRFAGSAALLLRERVTR
jgi:hypothetical protein